MKLFYLSVSPTFKHHLCELCRNFADSHMCQRIGKYKEIGLQNDFVPQGLFKRLRIGQRHKQLSQYLNFKRLEMMCYKCGVRFCKAVTIVVILIDGVANIRQKGNISSDGFFMDT